MNEQLIKIGLESGMLNYVDNETPRHYFLSGHADEQDLEKFVQLIVRECANFIDSHEQVDKYGFALDIVYGADLMKHFGVEE